MNVTATQSNEKATCILLDTNIWRSTLLLRSGLGPALMHLINVANIRIAVPEVIEGEITKQIINLAKDSSEKIERGFRDLGAILGAHRSYEIPKEEEIREAITKRFEELDQFVVRINFTLDHAKKALNRVNEKIPPSSSKVQQFKDAAIWEAALELGKEFQLFLITQDGDFFEDRERKSLNSVLKKECEELGVSIRIFSDLAILLSYLRDEAPKIDYDKIANSVYCNISNQLKMPVSRNGLRITDIRKPNISAFITENHDVLALDFEIMFDAIDIEGGTTEPKRNPIIVVEGDAKFQISTDDATESRIHSIETRWETEEGEVLKDRHVFLHAGTIYIGRQPDIPYSVRKRIDF